MMRSLRDIPVQLLMRMYLAEWSNMVAAGMLAEFNAQRGGTKEMTALNRRLVGWRRVYARAEKIRRERPDVAARLIDRQPRRQGYYLADRVATAERWIAAGN